MFLNSRRYFALLFLFLAGIILVVAPNNGCRKRDYRQTTIQVPAMTTADHAAAVSNALAQFEPAITSIQTDITDQTVTIKYNSMVLALKNMEYAIAEAGMDANDIKANTPPSAPSPQPAM